MKLYYAPGVCSQAPHILLREAELPFELEKVDLATKRTETGRDYWEINPNGYVPTLEIEPGLYLTEGPAIMQYIADKVPSRKLAPPAGSLERYRLQSWLNFITAEIHKGFSPLFKPDWPEEAKALVREQLAKRFDHVEAHLAIHGYLMGDTFTVADAYLFVTSGWAKAVGIDLARWPNLQAYRQRIAARQTVKAALAAEGLGK